MKTKRKNTKKDTRVVQNVEVYDHLNSKIEYIKSNELTLADQILAWIFASMVVILIVYIILS